MNAERGKPPFEGTVNGIRIQVEPVDVAAGCRTINLAPPRAAQGTAIEISPKYLPEGDIFTDADQVTATSVAITCDGEVVSVEQLYDIVIPDGAEESSIGISISIHRYRGDSVASAQLPAGRWSPGEIHGLPAAFAQPVVGTVGQSAVVIRHSEYVTRIFGQGVTLDTLKQIAEGVVE